MDTARENSLVERVSAYNREDGIGKYMTRRMIWLLVMAGVVLTVLFLWLVVVPWYYINVVMPKMPIPPQTVAATHPQSMVWQPQIRAVGTLHAVHGADLSTEVAGIVTRLAFNPGDDVKQGQLLIQLRDDSDRATLAALRAGAEQATQTYERNAALLKTNAISKQAYDTALANMLSSKAQAESQAATVAKKAIRAPFAGRIGIRMVDIGQYVNAGTAMVTLQQLDPIQVDFTADQERALILKPGDPVKLTTDAVPGHTFMGHIIALDPKVDPVTRNVRVLAEIANPNKVLMPGMFATVMTTIGQQRRQLTLPQTAITSNPYGDTVFVITHQNLQGKDQLVANQRFVTVGENRGDQVAVVQGLSDRDLVVTAGQMKLKNGTPVLINNSVKLPNNPAPTPTQE